MIVYKKTTPDTPVNNRIAYWTKMANRWMKQIECYVKRQAEGEDLQKHIDYSRHELEVINNQLALLRRYAE